MERGSAYLVRDNDGAYGGAFTSRSRTMGIRDRPISPRSPWQNPYVERLIGTLRRDCFDHVLIFGEQHLRQVLTAYSLYYNEARTHLCFGKDTPLGRAAQRSGRITVTPILSDCISATRGYDFREGHGCLCNISHSDWNFFPSCSVIVMQTLQRRHRGGGACLLLLTATC